MLINYQVENGTLKKSHFNYLGYNIVVYKTNNCID